MFAFFRWLERLSLDAVIVAVLWGWVLSLLAGLTVNPATLLVLAMATWLTYVADRLRDTAPGREVPETSRHLYYRRHYNQFRTIWLAVFPMTVLLAVLLLPLWKVLWGWSLVAIIAAYLHLLGKAANPSQRLLLKRLMVPIIFTAGVGWMAEGWRTMESGAAVLILFLASLVNVLLISMEEGKDSLVPRWLPGFLGASLVALVLAGNASLLIHWPVGVAALYCSMVYFVLLLRIKGSRVDWIRLWADAALADGAILIVILQFFL
ncbi:MAG: hypothetical protein AB3N64_09035 [Puniceicoccaceae bacterium]